jgi:iron transport multicopper oxidase
LLSQHWHGIFQQTTNWADGASFVTQCPITPKRSFLYKFSVPKQAGTFWWHSHLSMQYCDGLRGPMVVYDPDDPHMALYDVDGGLCSSLLHEFIDADDLEK